MLRTGSILKVDSEKQECTINKDQPGGLFASKTKRTSLSNVRSSVAAPLVVQIPKFNEVVKGLFRFQLEKDPGVEKKVLDRCNQLDVKYVSAIYTLMTRLQGVESFQAELTEKTQNADFPYALIRLCQEGKLTQSQFTHAYTLGIAVHPKDCQETDNPKPHRTVTLRVVEEKTIRDWVAGTAKGVSEYLKWEGPSWSELPDPAKKKGVLISELEKRLKHHHQSAVMVDRVYAEIDTNILFMGQDTAPVDFSDQERFHRFSMYTVGGAHFSYLPQDMKDSSKSRPVPVMPCRFYEDLFATVQSVLGVEESQKLQVAPVIGRFSFDQLRHDIGSNQRGVGLITPSAWNKMNSVEIDGSMSSRLYETVHDLYHVIKLIYYRDDLPEALEIAKSLLDMVKGWEKSAQINWKKALTTFLDTETSLVEVKRDGYGALFKVFLKDSPTDQPLPEIFSKFTLEEMLIKIKYGFKEEEVVNIFNQPRMRILFGGVFQFPEGDFTQFREIVESSIAIQGIQKEMGEFYSKPYFTELNSIAYRYGITSMETSTKRLPEIWYQLESETKWIMENLKKSVEVLNGTPNQVDLSSFSVDPGFQYLSKITQGIPANSYEKESYKALFEKHDPPLTPPSDDDTLKYFGENPKNSIFQFLADREKYKVPGC